MNFNDFISIIFVAIFFITASVLAIKGLFNIFFTATKEDFEVPIDFRTND